MSVSPLEPTPESPASETAVADDPTTLALAQDPSAFTRVVAEHAGNLVWYVTFFLAALIGFQAVGLGALFGLALLYLMERILTVMYRVLPEQQDKFIRLSVRFELYAAGFFFVLGLLTLGSAAWLVLLLPVTLVLSNRLIPWSTSVHTRSAAASQARLEELRRTPPGSSSASDE